MTKFDLIDKLFENKNKVLESDKFAGEFKALSPEELKSANKELSRKEISYIEKNKNLNPVAKRIIKLVKHGIPITLLVLFAVNNLTSKQTKEIFDNNKNQPVDNKKEENKEEVIKKLELPKYAKTALLDYFAKLKNPKELKRFKNYNLYKKLKLNYNKDLDFNSFISDLKRHEGFKEIPYFDPDPTKKHITVGYGTVIYHGKSSNPAGKNKSIIKKMKNPSIWINDFAEKYNIPNSFFKFEKDKKGKIKTIKFEGKTYKKIVGKSISEEAAEYAARVAAREIIKEFRNTTKYKNIYWYDIMPNHFKRSLVDLSYNLGPYWLNSWKETKKSFEEIVDVLIDENLPLEEKIKKSNELNEKLINNLKKSSVFKNLKRTIKKYKNKNWPINSEDHRFAISLDLIGKGVFDKLSQNTINDILNENNKNLKEVYSYLYKVE